jgi:hypothetical protein
VLIVVLAAACAALVILNVMRIADSGAEASRQAAGYSPPVLPASGAPVAPAGVAVLGEKSATDAEAVPSADLLGKGLDITSVSVTAVKGVRYVAGKGEAGTTFEAIAGTVPSGAAVVALVGGAQDRAATLPSLATAAVRTIRAVQEQAPSAEIVIVGPVSPGRASPSPGLSRVRDILAAAAAITSVHWVDPLAGRWLASPSTVSSNGRLTDAGKRELTRRLVAALAPFTPERGPRR